MATLVGIEGLISEALSDANEVQNDNRTREMSLVVTKLEEADMWLRKLQIKQEPEQSENRNQCPPGSYK